MFDFLQYRSLMPIYWLIVVGFLGYSMTVAMFVPMLMDTTYHILPATTSTGYRTTLAGFLLAMYPLGQFLGSPIIGALSDHFGRKKVLMFSLTLSIVGFLAIGITLMIQNIFWLFGACFLVGLSESNMAIAQSIVADNSSDPAERAKLIGYIYSMTGVGYVFGSLMPAMSSVVGYAVPFFIVGLGLVGLLYNLFTQFHDTYQTNKDAKIHYFEALTTLKSIFTDSNLRWIYLMNFIIFFAVFGAYRVLLMYVVDAFHFKIHTTSLLYAYGSLVCVFTNMYLFSWLSQQFDSKKLLRALLLISGVALIVVVIPKDYRWVWLTWIPAPMFTVMCLSACTAVLSSMVGAERQGRVLGNNTALQVLGESTSAIIGGLLAAILIKLPMIVMGLLLFFAAWLLHQHMRVNQKSIT